MTLTRLNESKHKIWLSIDWPMKYLPVRMEGKHRSDAVSPGSRFKDSETNELTMMVDTQARANPQ